MPRITIQDFTPYQESFKWTLHHAYFQNTGNKAWLNEEIPYEITSNYRAAYQKATIVIEALQICQISSDETFNILEPAAGSGIFALNFIKAFEDICKERQLNWLNQLHYMVSDYSVKSLQDMAKLPVFQAYKEEGHLDFYILDSTCPQNCSKLDENDFQLQPQSIFAIVSNYHFPVLPVSILKIENNQFYEKHIKLTLDSEVSVEAILKQTSKTDVESLSFQELNTLLNLRQDLLVEIAKFVPFNVESKIKDPLEKELLFELSSTYKRATFLNFTNVYKFLKNIHPFLKPKAILLFSELALNQLSEIRLPGKTRAILYQNSLNYIVNFPLIELYASKLGFQSHRTSNPEHPIQTLFLYNNTHIPDTLSLEFEKLYIKECKNFNAFYLSKAGHDYYQQNQLPMARFFFKQALAINKSDLSSLYHLASSYVKEAQYEMALNVLSQPYNDPFNMFQFDVLRGEIYFALKLYKQAKKHFVLALNSEKPEAPSIDLLQYLSKTCNKLKEHEQANEYYNQALSLSPEDKTF